MPLFDIGFTDILDILLVAFLLYQVYRLLKGTVAINILVGVAAIYLIWKLVEILHMRLLSEILGQFIGVGVVALIVVFQQEVRKFLLYVGTTNFGKQAHLARMFRWARREDEVQLDISQIIAACQVLSAQKTGALLVFIRKSQLGTFEQTGDRIDAELSSRLLESIFQKESPLHDGAVIIGGNRILAARCVLPVSDNSSLPSRLGMRHRAALGISERTDAVALSVSEQTGEVSISVEGQIFHRLSFEELQSRMEKLLAIE